MDLVDPQVRDQLNRHGINADNYFVFEVPDPGLDMPAESRNVLLGEWSYQTQKTITQLKRMAPNTETLLVFRDNGYDDSTWEDPDAHWLRAPDMHHPSFSEIFEVDCDVVVLPERMITVPERMFEYSHLKRVILPDGVKVIDISAFEHCTNLKSIELPKTLVRMRYAFFDLDSIACVYIPPELLDPRSNVPDSIKLKDGLIEDEFEDDMLPPSASELYMMGFFHMITKAKEGIIKRYASRGPDDFFKEQVMPLVRKAMTDNNIDIDEEILATAIDRYKTCPHYSAVNAARVSNFAAKYLDTSHNNTIFQEGAWQRMREQGITDTTTALQTARAHRDAPNEFRLFPSLPEEIQTQIFDDYTQSQMRNRKTPY